MSIGVDIGSSAVRAAEVERSRAGVEITRFAQVGLPSGAVVEGEVKDAGAVAEALRRLWREGEFRRREVVLGVNSQKAMVRQVEMPELSQAELRAALGYQIGNLIPIPIDQAVFDFSVLGPGRPTGDGAKTTAALVVVAQKDVVKDGFDVARRAGLRVRAMDSSALALLRAVPPSQGGGPSAVVCLGADLATVVVREGDVPRFVRTVSVVGARGASSEPTVPVGRASERPRGGATGTVATATKPTTKLSSVVEEVRGSVEYFLSHNQGLQLSEMVLTGGGVLQEGVAGAIASAMGLPVKVATVVPHWDLERLGLSEAQQQEASLRWATAVGLALWETDPHALSLVLEEVKQRELLRRAMAASAAAVVVVGAGLGLVSHSRVDAADAVSSQITADRSEAQSLQSKITALLPVTQVGAQVASRRSLATEVLSSDVDWVGLVERIAAALPPGVSITSMALQSASASSGTTPTGPGNPVGTVNISASTTGGPPSVAAFVRSVSKVRGLASLWVASSTASSGAQGGGAAVPIGTGKARLRAGIANNKTGPATMAFTATANVTAAALSKRSAKLPGGPR
ncbi:MAG: type IV pilus assembly protein PilM [Acidimicrobiales bacterium]